ncbi:MAG: hypothetical protein L0922_00600, partial [Candidatus Mariimomonas ferrooxydans]
MVISNFDLQSIRLIAPELVLICTAFILLMLDLIIKRKEIIAFTGVIGTLVSAFISYKLYAGGWSDSAFQGMFIFDGYAYFFNLIFYVSIILTIFISLKYMIIEKASLGEYYALLLHTTSTITHTQGLHTTSTITHAWCSTLPQPSLTPGAPHYLNH